ncbi:MAG TPA: tRNA lysidine(34) synthetase TilS [Stellaceae bacterium]|nr:tRNA lysidine(34) synthetase TilS [Stellaceae bacterium]
MPYADGDSDATPLSDEQFAAKLDRLGPFERAPRLAVAVSGGADSMALALLADRWARRRGGAITALTVDHRLRSEAAAEAREVGVWLAARGIAHETLVWRGPHPSGDIQAEARAARYRLLEARCARHGLLHLLTAHHRDDQAETFWLRLARGSGLDGLAGISAVSERPQCRVLRPLLDVPPARLRAWLGHEGQVWIEDPSNRNAAFARVRVREARAFLVAEGLSAERLEETLRHLGRARQALEAVTAGLLARAMSVHPLGFAWLDAEALRRAEAELGLRALAAALATIGGTNYPPRLERIERLYEALCRGDLGGGRTLGGCQLAPAGARVLVCRELAEIEGPVALSPGKATVWDGRFRVAAVPSCPAGISVTALGPDRQALPPGALRRLRKLPGAARATLPVLRDASGLVEVPALGWVRGNVHSSGIAQITFRPSRGLTPVGFTVV